jgi:hypothetical protein
VFVDAIAQREADALKLLANRSDRPALLHSDDLAIQSLAIATVDQFG